MRKDLFILSAVLLMVSCGNQSKQTVPDTQNASDSIATVSIAGEWLLEHVVVNDTLEIRPTDINPEAKLQVNFYNDSTFNFQTGCNSIGGRFVQTGDSISLSDLLWTEMACENMQTEELLRTILPRVCAIDWNNDSIIRLNTASSSYVVLKKE